VILIVLWLLLRAKCSPWSRPSFLLNMSSPLPVEAVQRVDFEMAEEAVNLSVDYVNSRADLLPGANLTFESVYSAAKV